MLVFFLLFPLPFFTSFFLSCFFFFALLLVILLLELEVYLFLFLFFCFLYSDALVAFFLEWVSSF